MTKKLTIVVPAYNEEEVLPSTIEKLLAIEDTLIQTMDFQSDSDILIVDDGSADRTWQIINTAHQKERRVKGLKFSRNFGHQNALIAGLQEAHKTADAMITIDADLQDDPTKIVEMATKFLDGTDIVYGVRNNRETDTWFKRNTALLFYKTLNRLGVNLIQNHADFRLMSRRAVTVLLSYKESNIFIRGIIPKLGFKTDKVFYKRTPRMAGVSKYPLKKMLSFAWDGITSLTIAPIRFILGLGGVIFVIGLLLYLLHDGLGIYQAKSANIIASIWTLGGLQLLGIGVIGEYLGKVGLEVKRRPRFTIEEILK